VIPGLFVYLRSGPPRGWPSRLGGWGRCERASPCLETRRADLWTWVVFLTAEISRNPAVSGAGFRRSRHNLRCCARGVAHTQSDASTAMLWLLWEIWPPLSICASGARRIS